VDDIATKIGHFCTFQTSVTITLTLYHQDQVIWHIIICHSSTSTYIPNFVQIGKTFLWMGGRTLRRALLGRIRDDLKGCCKTKKNLLKTFSYVA